MTPSTRNEITDLGAGKGALLFAFMTAILMWPAIVNGGAFMMRDSASYYRGGEVGVDIAGVALMDLLPSAAAKGAEGTQEPNDDPREVIENASGARSPIYSVALYLMSGPGKSLLFLVGLHALAIAFLITSLIKSGGGGTSPRVVLTTAALAGVGTAAPWYAAYGMPDVLAGILILAAGLLAVGRDRLELSERLVVSGLMIAAIVSHASHVPLAAGLVLCAVPISYVVAKAAKIRTAVRTSAWLGLPLIFGMISISLANYAGFGDTNVFAKSYPFALARSIGDGPALRHLEETCDVHQYTVCEIYEGEAIPDDAGDFLWGERGIAALATPEQIAQMNREQAVILKRITSENSGEMLTQLIVNTARQLVTFDISPMSFGNSLERLPDGDVRIGRKGEDRTELKTVFKAVHLAVLGASILAMAIVAARYRSALTRSDLGLIAVVVLGLGGNAFICGSVSAVVDRYQGRVIWVLPLVLGVIAWRVARDARSRATAAA